MKTLLFLLCASTALGQVLPPPGFGANGQPLVTQGQFATTGPLTLYVDNTNGKDSNTCTSSGAGACKTIQAACNLIPQQVRHGVTVNVAGGTYAGGGCWLEGRTIASGGPGALDGGAYIDFEGSPVTAAVAGTMSGTVASATQVSGITQATLTPTVAGYTASTLRGMLVQITSKGNETLAIYDNSTTVITLAGQWTVTPVASDTFAIIDPCGTGATLLTGGVTLPISGPALGTANAASALLPSNTNWSAFAFFNNLSVPSAQPGAFADGSAAWLFWNPGGSIYVRGFCANSFGGSFVQARQSPGVHIARNKVLEANVDDFCYTNTDTRMQVVSNYFNDATALNTAACKVANSLTTQISLLGNVGDNVMAYTQSAGVTNVDDTGQVTLVSVNNSWRTPPDSTYLIGACMDCVLKGDWIESHGGAQPSDESCVEVGVGMRAASSTTYRGNVSSGQIQGGFWNGCAGTAGAGLHLQGGLWALRGTAVLSGTAGLAGILLGDGARLQLATNGLATITGSGGDTSLDNGATFLSYTNLNTFVLVNNPLSGATIVTGNATGLQGKQVVPQIDTSGTPGNATANTASGRSAIAIGASAAVITNAQVTATSRVHCSLETVGSGIGSIACLPAAGSFTATSISGTGVATNVATAAAKFTWEVRGY